MYSSAKISFLQKPTKMRCWFRKRAGAGFAHGRRALLLPGRLYRPDVPKNPGWCANYLRLDRRGTAGPGSGRSPVRAALHLPDPSHPKDAGWEKGSILFGDPESPYIRFDPYSMGRPGSQETRAAMDYLIQELGKLERRRLVTWRVPIYR